MVNVETMIQNEYFKSILILVGAFIVAQIVDLVLRKYVKRLTEKTKSDVDDIILSMLTKPLYLIIILGGLYFSLKAASIFAPYASWIDRIFFIFAVLIIALLVSRVFTFLISHWLKVQKRFEKTPQVITKVVNIIVYIIALMMILSYFNVEISPLIATLGLGGLAVGLALQNTLSNFFAGLHIISDRPVNVGDYIELEGGSVKGYVTDIGWRSTRVRTLPNTMVVVPNAKLAESTIVNNSLPQKEMSLVVQCGVDYGSDLKKVERVTIDVAKNIQKTVEGAVKDHKPFIRFHTFADSNINFSIILRIEKYVDKYRVRHEFIKALKARYDKEKIEISWPVRKVYKAK